MPTSSLQAPGHSPEPPERQGILISLMPLETWESAVLKIGAMSVRWTAQKK